VAGPLSRCAFLSAYRLPEHTPCAQPLAHLKASIVANKRNRLPRDKRSGRRVLSHEMTGLIEHLVSALLTIYVDRGTVRAIVATFYLLHERPTLLLD